MQLGTRLFFVLAILLVLDGYVFLAVRESRDREAERPEPAPIGVTVDPAEPIEPVLLEGGGFDFAAVQWSPERQSAAARAVSQISSTTELKYALFVPSENLTKAALDLLSREYPKQEWQHHHDKPLIYAFGRTAPAKDARFSIVLINDRPSGKQYWVANPPNIKYGHMTLTPGFVGGGLKIERTAATLDQQELFAETNKDRTALLLWHSWNVREDRSALLPSLVFPGPGAVNSVHPAEYAYDRVKAFNERWKRP